jgi:hypothetical protein
MLVELSTSQLAALAGASDRKVDYWIRTGRLTPARIEGSAWSDNGGPGTGTRRKFDVSHVKVAMVLRDLMALSGRWSIEAEITRATVELERTRGESWEGEWMSLELSPITSIMVDLEAAERAAELSIRTKPGECAGSTEGEA